METCLKIFQKSRQASHQFYHFTINEIISISMGILSFKGVLLTFVNDDYFSPLPSLIFPFVLRGEATIYNYMDFYSLIVILLLVNTVLVNEVMLCSF